MKKAHVICFLLALVLLDFFTYASCGSWEKRTAVLFDEYHSSFEANSFKKLFSIIEDLGFRVIHGKNSLSSQDLSDIAMIVIVEPSTSFLDDEIIVIQEFLRNGGSLLIACDPSSSSIINEFSEGLKVLFSSHYLSEGQDQGIRVRAEASELGEISFMISSSGHIQGEGIPLLVSHADSWEDFIRNNVKDPQESYGPFTVGAWISSGGRAVFLASTSIIKDQDAWEPGQQQLIYYIINWLLLPQKSMNSILEAKEEIRKAEEMGIDVSLSKRAIQEAQKLIEEDLYAEALRESVLAVELVKTSIELSNASSLLSQLSYELAQEESRGVKHDVQASELTLLLNAERSLREKWLDLVSNYEKLSTEEKMGTTSSIKSEATWISSKALSLLQSLWDSIEKRVYAKLEACSILLDEAKTAIEEIKGMGSNMSSFEKELEDLWSTYNQSLFLIDNNLRDAEIVADGVEQRASKLLEELKLIRSKTLEVHQTIGQAETLLFAIEDNLRSGKWLLIRTDPYEQKISSAENLIEGAKNDLFQGNYEKALMKANRSVEILRYSYSYLKSQIEFREKVACLGFLGVPALLSLFLLKDRKKREDLVKKAAKELKIALEEVTLAKEEGIDVTKELSSLEEAGKILDQVVQNEEDPSIDRKVVEVEKICEEVLETLRSERLARRICLAKMSSFSEKSGKIIEKALRAAKYSGFLSEEISNLLNYLSNELQLILKEFRGRRYKNVVKRLDTLEETLNKLEKLSNASIELMNIYQSKWRPKIRSLVQDAGRPGGIPLESFSFIPKEFRRLVLSEIAPRDFKGLRLVGNMVVICSEGEQLVSEEVEESSVGEKEIEVEEAREAIIRERSKLDVEGNHQLNKAKDIIKRACIEEASRKLKEKGSVSRVKINLKLLEGIEEETRRIAIRGFIAEMLIRYGIRCYVSGDWLVAEGDLRNVLIEDVRTKK